MIEFEPETSNLSESELKAELQRLRAENAQLRGQLLDRDGWFRGLIENMADGLIAFDHMSDGDFRVSYANQRAGAILGYSVDQLTGQDYLGFVHPEDRERIASRKLSASAGARLDKETYRAIRSDGAVIWLTTHSGVAPLEMAPATKTRTITSLRDVTEEHAREAALADARSKIDHILQIIPGVFYQVTFTEGEGYKLVYVSESVCEVFDISYEEASRPGFIFEAALVDLYAARMAALGKAGRDGIATHSFPARFKDEVLWLRETMRWRDRPDGGREVVGFITDVTAEHEADVALRRANWALAAYSRSLSVLLRSGTTEELMMRICESIVEQPAYILAAFAVPDHGPGLPVRFIAHAGSIGGYLDGMDINWSADDPHGAGPVGSAMRDGVPRVMHDAWTDPTYARKVELGKRYGVRSAVIVPSLRDGKVFGGLLVYGSEPDIFGPAEISLFQRLSDEIAFAVGVEEDQRRLQEANQARLQAEQNLRAAVQLGPGIIYRAKVTADCVGILGLFGDPSRIALGRAGCDQGSRILKQILEAPERIAAFLALSDDVTHSEDCSVAAPDGSLRWLRNAFRISERDRGGVELIGYVAEVTQEKLQQLRHQQVATLLTLGEMAAGMAHELRQPLSSIMLAAESAAGKLKRQADPPADVANMLEKIIGETERAGRLIDHMRIFARNDQERQQPLSCHDCLISALEILKSKTRGIRIVNEIPADLPQVMGWPIPFEQVFINLIGNAVDAYHHRSPTSRRQPARVVKVSGEAVGNHVVLRVEDWAGGIAAHAMGRLFEPFFTTKAVGKGTGLGLAIVVDAVREMGGTISAVNEGNGARFEVRLPIAP